MSHAPTYRNAPTGCDSITALNLWRQSETSASCVIMVVNETHLMLDWKVIAHSLSSSQLSSDHYYDHHLIPLLSYGSQHDACVIYNPAYRTLYLETTSVCLSVCLCDLVSVTEAFVDFHEIRYMFLFFFSTQSWTCANVVKIYSVTVVSTPTFHISWPVTLKYRTGELHEMPLTASKFHKNRCSENIFYWKIK